MRDMYQLIGLWRLRRAAYAEQWAKTDDPSRRALLEAMNFQLEKCIEELEGTLAARSPEKVVAQTLLDYLKEKE